MDTKNFLAKRTMLMEDLERRRSTLAEDYKTQGFGLSTLPMLARWVVGMAPRRGVLTSLIEIGMSLAVPLFFNRKSEQPLLSRLVNHFLAPKA